MASFAGALRTLNELKESTSIDPTLLAEILGRFPLEPQPT